MIIIDKGAVQTHQTKSADNHILIDKPADWSSFDVVKKIRALTGIRKVGHAGTLDPFATGLLILGTGKQTKDLTQLSQAKKEYKAVLELGKSTDTFDITGKITGETNQVDLSDAEFETVLNDFRGDIEQIPPMFSAKKINGKRLYKLARQGEEVERKPQKITIYEIKKIKRRGVLIEIHVKCSKGTYIRSLAHDIGQKCGCGAFLRALERTAIDPFYVTNALSMHAFENYWKTLN
jgi:tRNA pseudouridine55 synthase